jgi:hypothetical protein
MSHNSIGCGKGRDGRWHASVRLDMERYLQLRDGLLARATRYDAAYLAANLHGNGYARFAPLRRQLLNILRAVNRARRMAGVDDVPITALPLKRLIIQPFYVSFVHD